MQEKVSTVGIRLPKQSAGKFSALMEELRRLVETAGGVVMSEFQQRRDHLDPGTLIGRGKAEEISQALAGTGIRTVVFDDDLTAAQQKNLEKIIKAKIVDRTRLILDIFARRAHTREGQLQIELAQLNYLVPRLTGAWRGYSQQMGGIGTRGPGEKKIEVERRYVRERIKRLKADIESIRGHRDRARDSRQAVPLPQVALVGYTNVGKSTLLNALVGETAVYADDKLFATLDPTTRRVRLPGGRHILFTDTVGFIQKLPHDLVAAFRATLEEVAQASILVHVVDATADDRADQEKTVLDVIKSLGADTIPMITVLNKIDALPASVQNRLGKDGVIGLSAKTGAGLSAFLTAVEKKSDENLVEVTFDLPHRHGGLIADLYTTAHILSREATAQGTRLRLRIDSGNLQRLNNIVKIGPASMSEFATLPAVRQRVLTLATKITILRILLIPFIVVGLVTDHRLWVYVLLGFSVFTDFLDGLMARRRGERTRLGAFLDPMADKLLLTSVYLALTYKNLVAIWIFVAIFSRDLLIVLGWCIIYILTNSTEVKPRYLGKASTAAQMVTAFACLLAVPHAARNGMLILTLALTVASAIDYVIVGQRRLGEWG